MRAWCIMHVPYEGPGFIEEYLYTKGIALNFLKLYEKPEFPDPSLVDFLLVMGGPMNIYEYEKYPWLKEEKEFIKNCIGMERKVIGICLGAQLIADVLGEKTFKNSEKEIGWFPVAGNRDYLPGSFTPFHWHGETFEIPGSAIHIGSSLVCRNQGFAYRDIVLALQFHLEVSPALVEGLIENAASDLKNGDWVQSKKELREGMIHMEKNKSILFGLLDNFIGMSGGG